MSAAWADFQQRGGVADLASRAKILCTGADRLRYLNGQVTANLLSAPNPGVVPACLTTAKGRLCADGFISLGPGGILFDADAALREALVPRLERYIVADDVVVEDATERIAIVHCLGVEPGRLAALSGLMPLPANRYGLPGWDLFPPFRADLPALWARLTAEIPVLDEGFLESLRIEHGVPRWGRELDENTLPPEAGLDRTHIDYHKGCYVGQEVISRLKSIGHVNRRLVRLAGAGGAPPAVGAELTSEGRVVGKVTSAGTRLADGFPVALAYLARATPVDAALLAEGMPVAVIGEAGS